MKIEDRMYAVVKASKEISIVYPVRVTETTVHIKNHCSQKIEIHKIKGKYRRYFKTGAEATRAANKGW